MLLDLSNTSTKKMTEETVFALTTRIKKRASIRPSKRRGDLY